MSSSYKASFSFCLSATFAATSRCCLNSLSDCSRALSCAVSCSLFSPLCICTGESFFSLMVAPGRVSTPPFTLSDNCSKNAPKASSSVISISPLLVVANDRMSGFRIREISSTSLSDKSSRIRVNKLNSRFLSCSFKLLICFCVSLIR